MVLLFFCYALIGFGMSWYGLEMVLIGFAMFLCYLKPPRKDLEVSILISIGLVLIVGLMGFAGFWVVVFWVAGLGVVVLPFRNALVLLPAVVESTSMAVSIMLPGLADSLLLIMRFLAFPSMVAKADGLPVVRLPVGLSDVGSLI